jgi:uncharacterized protein (DUF924 family)
MTTPEDILDFWFSERTRPLWFAKEPDFDEAIRRRFMMTFQAAAEGRLADWEKAPYSALALVIVLDQVPLNMFRHSPHAFSTEAEALRVAKAAVAQGFDCELTDEQKQFLYLPFMHSENREDQQRSVALFAAAGLKDALQYAIGHKEIVDRFGRFPHRNRILGRESTPEEIEFLQQPGSSF